jgi:glycosyltransferase involved in cell wall biosynthesis
MRLTELVTPLKPLEAMAQGHLFVASDVGGHKELIRHGETGWLSRLAVPTLTSTVWTIARTDDCPEFAAGGNIERNNWTW